MQALMVGQVVPHITTAIQDWILRVSQIPVDDGGPPDVCVIELGGTVGDIESMPFVEALRQFQFRTDEHGFMLVHVSLVRLTTINGKCHNTKRRKGPTTVFYR